MPDVPPTLSFEEKLKQLRREKLKPLLHDSEIARTVEDCQPRELYRLLLKKRKTCRLADRPLIDTILSSRRLFAEKVRRAPTLFTINGVGSKLYGKQEVDPGDGTYIATLYAVLLYIPLYPLAQYWVHPAGGRRWSFLGKVPLNKAALLWRRIAAGAALAAACAVAICVLYTKTFTNLYLVNGLDIPVAVAIDSARPVQVPGNSQRAVSNLRHGRHHLATRTVGGEPVEELDVDVPLAKDVIAYNVIGAAPLSSVGVQYFVQGHAPSDPGHMPRNEQHNYCGQRFIVCDNVQDVFVSPPTQIKMESDTVIRWTFNRDHGGWVKTLRILSYEEKHGQATALAEQIARIEPENEQAVWYGIEYARIERGMTQAM